jgi:TraM recognition site of TraD and TraG
MMDFVKDRFGGLVDPLRDVWGFYQGLDPEQQRSALLLALVGAAAFAVWVAYQAYGDRVVIVLPAWMLRTFLLVLALPFVALGRAAGRGTNVPGFLTRSWTAEPDPERPRVQSRNVDPMKLPNKSLPQDQWHLFDRDWERLYAVGVISKAGGGKDETLIGPALFHELLRGSSDVVVMDPKLEQLAAAHKAGYLPRGSDLYVYGTSPRLSREWADAFDVFALERNLTTARILTEEESRDSHWQHKAADLVVATREALEEETGEKATLADVREVVADREALKELRRQSRRVDNVADEEKEWGYVRSTAVRALEPLESARTRALFDASRIRMPDFASQRRQIVFLCPDPGAGEEEAKLTAAMVEVLVQLSRQSGPARIQKFFINEAASFTSLTRLPQYVDIGRGEGVYLMYVLQSYSQLVKRLGAAGARNLWTGSAAQVVGQGAEPELAEEMSRYTNPVRLNHRLPRQYGQHPGGEHLSEERRQALLMHHITGLGTGQWVMRVAPEIHRYEVLGRHTHSARLAAIRKKRAAKGAAGARR